MGRGREKGKGKGKCETDLRGFFLGGGSGVVLLIVEGWGCGRGG